MLRVSLEKRRENLRDIKGLLGRMPERTVNQVGNEDTRMMLAVFLRIVYEKMQQYNKDLSDDGGAVLWGLWMQVCWFINSFFLYHKDGHPINIVPHIRKWMEQFELAPLNEGNMGDLVEYMDKTASCYDDLVFVSNI
jgi:hypothetical protein